jgi:uncharacterized protein
VTVELPSADEVDAAAAAMRLATGASELHGALSGWIAGGGAVTPRWLAQVMADPSLPDASSDALARLAEATQGQLEDRDFGFELVLPGEDDTLERRSGALFDWCRGFVGGFGLAAGAASGLSEEGTEALADIARLAGAQAQDDGDDEDEAALAEIVEFVRVAALLLHGDVALAARHRARLN